MAKPIPAASAATARQRVGFAAGQRSIYPVASPIVKWAGGKTQLLKHYSRLFPAEFNRYYEPFLGGGAVFFHLVAKNPNLRATLSDQNVELINCYNMIKNELPSVIRYLKKHKNDSEHFYKVRAQDVDDLSPAERAARLIFLNKTCFNGLYRVNRKGQFNVPFGRYENPKICDEVNLRAAERALCNAKINTANFEAVASLAKKGDFVYLDPPYQPLSTTSSFTGYTRNSFGEADQIRLANMFKKLTDKGCYAMLSNSDTPFIRELYEDFNIETVYANRAINSKADKRGRVAEVAILNYSPDDFNCD